MLVCIYVHSGCIVIYLVVTVRKYFEESPFHSVSDMNEWSPSCSLPVLTSFFWRFAFLARHNPQNDSPPNWNSGVKYDHRANREFARWTYVESSIARRARILLCSRIVGSGSLMISSPRREAMDNNRDCFETICLWF